MKTTLFSVILFLAPFQLQDSALEKHIVRTHDNGNPYVVVYTLGKQQLRVKEELYFDNGNLDYVGHYKGGVEHGEWVYYWENGNVKSWEYYELGLEEGAHYDCDEQGNKVRVYHYRKGTLLREELIK